MLLADVLWEWPAWEEFLRVVSLRDHNTRVVVLGTLLLGAASGAVGTFLLLRKRALMADALSHATLPGICIAFLVMAAAGGSGKWLPGLLLGATISGIIGVLCILAIRNTTRLKEDAALGIVLSVFFGLGIVLLSLLQKSSQFSAAGLESFIYGKTASMLTSDAWLIAGAAGVVGLACIAFFKEFGLLCFDAEFAGSQGWPVIGLDLLLMALVIAVTVIGLQAVGLILVVALLIVPPAAARFWTERLRAMVLISATIGACSGVIGASASALQPRMPAGAVIVLAAVIAFVVSLLFGPARGVVPRVLAHWKLRAKIGQQHLLRAAYEIAEERAGGGVPQAGEFALADLLHHRAWTQHQVARLVRIAQRDGLVESDQTRMRLTPQGLAEAARLTRNHRLWELYLITHADIAPSHVDRDADQLEHVLPAELVDRLEAILDAEQTAKPVPASPHALGT